LLHRRSDIYPDPGEFRPQRFLDTAPAAHEMTTFGGGQRQCIGNQLALLEIKTVVAAALESRNLRLSESAISVVARGVHLVPGGGLQVVAPPR
jgi:cytochrome P450